MRTIEEVLNCVNYCMFSKGCTKENYDCCYGDKGLSDCDIRLENDYKKIMAEVKKINTFDRLEEICNAERDGRCVVLPCGIGDTVWFKTQEFDIAKGTSKYVIDEYIITEIRGNKYNPLWYMVSSERCIHRDFHPTEIGRNVFLSKEQAEQALKGGV